MVVRPFVALCDSTSAGGRRDVDPWRSTVEGSVAIRWIAEAVASSPSPAVYCCRTCGSAGAGVAAVAAVPDQRGVPAAPADGPGPAGNWAAGAISAGAAGPTITLQAGVAAGPTLPARAM